MKSYVIWHLFSTTFKSVIPKDIEEQRMLCIPSVYDRVAQTTAAIYLESLVEPKFHENSYGYQPNKSALQAVDITRKKC